MYHKSPPSLREKILKEGLIPMVGDSYSLHYNEPNLKPAIFACDGKDYDSTWDDDIWEIDKGIVKWEADKRCYKGCYITYQTISPENIRLIYKGTGKSTL